MPDAIGQKTIFGLKVETSGAEGTAVALGAGNKREMLEGSGNDPQASVGYNEDALNEDITESWLNDNVPKKSWKANFRFQGHEEELGVLFGTLEDPVQMTNPRAYIHEFKISNLTRALTAVIAKGQGKSASSDILEVLEMAGARYAKLAISQGQERAEAVWDAIAKAWTYGSSTNTSSTALNMTMPSSSFPPPFLLFDHLNVYLAHQETLSFGASHAVDLSSVSWELIRGLADSNEELKASSGFILPYENKRRSVKAAFEFVKEDSTVKQFLQYARAKSLMKSIIEWLADKGIPGCSISGAGPSQDISGGTDGNLKVTITLIDSKNGNVSETYSLSLTPGSLNSGALIAAAIQTAVRAKTATDARLQEAINNFVCNYDDDVENKYFLTIDSNKLFNVTVEDGDSDNVADDLNLGTANGGTEPGYQPYLCRLYLPELCSNIPGDEYKVGSMKKKFEMMALARYGTDTPDGFTSSDTYLQSDMQNEICRMVLVNRLSSNPLS